MSEEEGLVEHPIFVDVENGDVRVLDERFFFYYPQRMVGDGSVCYQFDGMLGADVIHRIGISKVTMRPAEANFHNIYQVFESGGL
jgi:hypothetical protein